MLSPHGNGQGVRLSLIWLLPRILCSSLKRHPSLICSSPVHYTIDPSSNFVHPFGHKWCMGLPGSSAEGLAQEAKGFQQSREELFVHQVTEGWQGGAKGTKKSGSVTWHSNSDALFGSRKVQGYGQRKTAAVCLLLYWFQALIARHGMGKIIVCIGLLSNLTIPKYHTDQVPNSSIKHTKKIK